MKLVFFVSFFVFLNAHAKNVDGILAIVNKNIILKSDLTELKENLEKGVLVDLEYASLFDLKKLKEDKKTQIDFLIGEQLFLDHARKNGIYDKAEDQLDAEIQKIAANNGLSLPEFKKEITQQGVSFSDYKLFILDSLIRKRVIDSEITSRIEISESDIIQFLLQQGSQAFKPRYQYSLSHIVVNNEQDAEKVMDSLKRSSFDEALKYSLTPESNGFLGVFKESELAKALRPKVTELKISEVSGPISMNGKVFFIRLDDKKRINELPDTPEVRRAKMSLVQENISNEVQAWIEEKRQTSHVVIKES